MLRVGRRRGCSHVWLPAGLMLICFTPLVLATLGTIGFIALAVIRWINEHEDSRLTRALWAALWGCGLAMVGLVGARFLM